jgi:hypothetical protein
MTQRALQSIEACALPGAPALSEETAAAATPLQDLADEIAATGKPLAPLWSDGQCKR